MGLLVKPRKVWSGETYRFIRSPHLWSIFFIILALILLYYAQVFFTSERVEWLWRLAVFEYKFHLNASLFYIPVIYAAIIFGWRGTLITWLLCMAIIMPRVVYFSSNLSALLSNILFLMTPIMVVLLITLLSKWVEGERKTLAERETQYKAYMSEAFKAREDERKRIAQGLHDDTTQTLLVIANRIQSFLNNKEGGETPQRITKQLEMFRDSILDISEGVKRLSLDLRPSILDNLGLVAALRWLVDNLNDDSLNAQIVLGGKNRKLPAETEIALYRFVQEAINNVRCHAEATQVVINFEFCPETVKIAIQDNGKGFIVPKDAIQFATQGKFGIIGMQEKASFLGGTFNVCSKHGKGTVVSMEVRV